MPPKKKSQVKKASATNGKPSDRKPSYPGSLLSLEAMGGINAGKGFDFQTRYAACGVPRWLLETTFHQLLS